jgi:hypothetical protein
MPWPLFPIDRAPWPLLMPLARRFPLSEAQYIWQLYQGQQGGPAQFHTYGPYRKPDVQLSFELRPSQWPWGSWQGSVEHGGECVVMSGISWESHLALGWPSVRAGQPGHSNLITFKYTDGAWLTDVEQAFAGGPDVTHAQWPFNDKADPTARRGREGEAGAEYHLGMAQAMNIGLRRYIDTRIAVHLFRALPTDAQSTLGGKLLSGALETNPFNPEPWYLLARQASDIEHGLALAKAAMKKDPGGIDDSPGGPPASFENFVEAEHAKPEAQALLKYWRTVEEFVTRVGVLHFPVATDDATARSVYEFLKAGVPGITDAEQSPYRIRFEGQLAAAPPATPASKGKKKQQH